MKRINNNGIYQCSYLAGKKVLVLVPHEDDELITVGLILPILLSNHCTIIFAYATNGDYKGTDQGKVRLKEALIYGQSQGIAEEDIIFMGFGDQGELGPHIYNTNQPIASRNGNAETYALENHPSYAKQKYGYELIYTRENYKKILMDIIKDQNADIIFCVDCDIHSDHIVLSLMFEEVLTELIRENNYQPIVYKMFAHDMQWMGIEDSHGINLEACLPIAANPHHTYAVKFQEAYYPWSERIRFPIERSYISRFAFNNPFRKTMKAYKSQFVPYHFPRLYNSDQIFWLRRTDNLILLSKVSATSGDTSCFLTMKMFDSQDICKKQSLLEESRLVWRPDPKDMEKKVFFHFHQPVRIYKLILYTGFCNAEIQNVELHFDQGLTVHSGELKSYGQPNTIYLPQEITCRNLEACFSGSKVEMIKLEAFSDVKPEIMYVKIILEQNFIYQYRTSKQERNSLNFQLYHCLSDRSEVLQARDSRYQWYLRTTNGKDYMEDVHSLSWRRKKKIRIGVELIDNPKIFDEVDIITESFFSRLFIKTFGKLEWAVNKVIYKIIRIRNRGE